MEFIEVFTEIFKIFAALILIFLIGKIVLMMMKMDRNMLKAKLFLNNNEMLRTMTFISISGAAYVLNTFFNLVSLVPEGNNLYIYYLNAITLFIFIMFFTLGVYNWREFLSSFADQ